MSEGVATTLQAPAPSALVVGVFAAIRRDRITASALAAASNAYSCGRCCYHLDRRFIRTQRIVLAMAEFGP